MADLTIFQLTQILPGAVDSAADLVPLWDNSATETKKITVADLKTALGSSVLADTNIFVGNASNVATSVALTLSGTGGAFGLANTGVLTMPNANASTRGLLVSADWTTFNNKLTSTLADGNIFVGNASNVATAVTLSLSATGGTFGLANTGILTMPDADASTRGLLTAADWNTFNSKSTIADWTSGFGSGTQATSTWSSTNAAANVNAAIIPKGTGAFLLDLPDGTATGGNARGASAVDLQHVRSAATQVASGANSVIGGGLNNTSAVGQGVVAGGTTNIITAGASSFIGGGSANTINSAATGLSFIGGGDTNTNAGIYTSIVGGQQNTVNALQWGFIGGGFSNQITGNGNVVVGGYDNTGNGTYSFVGGGETNNLASGSYATLVGGQTNLVSANWGFIGGGLSNQLNEQFTSIVGGRNANATLYGMQAYSAGQFSALADAQMATIQMRRLITGTAIADLFLDGASVLAILPATNTLWMARVQIAAICTNVGGGSTLVLGASYVTERHVGIKRLNTTTSLVGTVQTIGAAQSDTTMSTSAVTITANDTDEALRIQFTPPSTAGASSTIRVVATIQLTQVKY